MLPMSEDFLIDLSPSCTKEQAVLRLLGWNTETIYKKYFRMNTDGNVVTDMKDISPIAIDLHELLTDTYQEALQRYEDAVPKDPSEEEMEKILDEHGPRIAEAKARVQEARNYLMDITDELAKPHSALRIDQESTAKVGSICITIRSLEEWESIKYEDASQLQGDKSDSSEDDYYIDDDTIPKNIKAKYKNLLISFSIAIKYITEDSYQFKYKGHINIKNVSEELSRKAQVLAKTGDRPMAGQGDSSFRDRIKAAQKVLDTRIPKT